jgi:hypothetical protein
MMMKHMVQRSLSFMVLAAGLVSCSGDPTESLRNGVDQLLADPSEMIVDQATTELVVVQAFDEQGNAVQARFSVTAAPGITVTFDSSFNRVFDANGKLKPQNPATRVRYIVQGDVVGASSFTVTGGGKSTTIAVRVPPPAVAATIAPAAPGFGDTITVTLPAPATFAFDPADTASVATTIGGNTCRVITVNAARTALSCIPLPGSVGAVLLKNVLPGFGGLGPINVPTVGTVNLTLPTLTYSPANPQAGDTVTIIAPPRFDFRTTSAVTLSGATTFVTLRVADTLKFLVGPGVNAPLSITNLLVTGSAASANTFTLAAGNLTTPALPILVSNLGGSQAVGTVISVASTGRYRFSPAASSSVTLRSVLPGINAGATVTSVSADSLTLQYAIGPSVDTTAAVIGGVRISGAAGLGTFSLNTDKVLFTPVIAQFPATLSNQLPIPGDQPVTLTAGAGFKFTPSSTIQVGSPLVKALVQSISADSTQMVFLPSPNSGKAKPVVSNIIATATPNVKITLPAAVYLTAGPPGAVPDLDNSPTIVVPTAVGQTNTLVGFGVFAELDECLSETGTKCRAYKFTLPAAVRWNVVITQSGGDFDMGVYILDSSRVAIKACDALAAAATENCNLSAFTPGSYWLTVVNYTAANPPDWQVVLTGIP